MSIKEIFDARTTVIVVMLSLVLIMLIVDFFIFMDAKYQIGLYNEKRLENCLLLECDVTPLGKVECKTLVSASDLDGVLPSMLYIEGNGSDIFAETT